MLFHDYIDILTKNIKITNYEIATDKYKILNLEYLNQKSYEDIYIQTPFLFNRY